MFDRTSYMRQYRKTEKYKAAGRRYEDTTIYKAKKKIRKHKWLEVVAHYTKNRMTCESCNEDDMVVLSVNHINGNGTRHRKAIGFGGIKFYRWLIKNNYPEGYNILCMNCQFKHRYKILQYGKISDSPVV